MCDTELGRVSGGLCVWFPGLPCSTGKGTSDTRFQEREGPEVKRLHLLAPLALAIVALTSCISSKSYVDPQFRRATMEELTVPDSPPRVALVVEFQRNGAPMPAGDGELRSAVVAALRKTGLATVVSDGGERTLRVVGNNIADVSAAKLSGFGTGLTLGLAGSTVTDFYEFQIELSGGGRETQGTYKHAVHSRVGAGSAPIPGVEPSSTGQAFSQVVEDVLLNFFSDQQAAGALTLDRGHPRPVS